MSTAFDRITAKLSAEGFTVNDNGHGKAQAQCPAHDDIHPSLGITGIDGSVLLYCHAGCDTGDVLAALGCTMADLYDSPKGADYVYPDGRVVHRSPAKRFTQSVNAKGASLFHSDRVTAGEITVYVCEGEKDCLAVESAGGTAVSPPMGASTDPDRFDWKPLAGKHVTVVADKDDAGRQHAHKVADLLSSSIAKSVKVVEARTGKDAADHIAAGHALAEFVDADWWTEPTSLLDTLGVSAEWLDGQVFPNLEYAVADLIPEGFGLIAAPPKKGKSFLVANIGLAVASGGVALQRIEVIQRPVLYLALEDGYRRLQARLRRMNADKPLPPNLTLIIRATPAEAIATIGEYLSRYGDQKPLVIVDTLGKVKRAKRAGEESYQADYAVGAQFKALADAAPGSTVLVVHHTRKAASDDFVDSLSGTQGLAGSADFVIVLARERNSDNAVLSITGRDVIESDYGLHADDGILWRLEGDTLADAHRAADVIRRTAELERSHGNRAVQIVRYVNEDQRVVTPADIAEKFGMEAKRASELLTRLGNGGFLTKLSRGEYGPGL